MKTDHDARQALEALLRDDREGFSLAKLKELVAQELSKGDDMDADLVAEALRSMDGAQPTFDMAANWAAIEKKLEQRHTALSKRHTRWPVLVAAFLTVFAVISVGTLTTEAWHWDSLIRVFRPIMGTLGIHVNVDDLGGAGEVVRTEATMSPGMGSETVSRILRDESEVPNTIRGIATKPSWLPEGYTFHSAQVFDDHNESSLMITYRNGPTELFVHTVVYPGNDTLTAVNVFEKDDKEAEDARSVTIIENDGVITATSEDNLAYYMVWGRLSRADISSVITSIR